MLPIRLIKKTAMMKFWKHTHLPIECNIKVDKPSFKHLGTCSRTWEECGDRVGISDYPLRRILSKTWRECIKKMEVNQTCSKAGVFAIPTDYRYSLELKECALPSGAS